MKDKRVMVLGASLNPERYSHRAVKLLRYFDYNVDAIGLREGRVADVQIKKEVSDRADIHTVTIYLSPKNQLPYYDLFGKIKPERVIFNPGTENEELKRLLENEDIEVVENCTLVMLNYDMF